MPRGQQSRRKGHYKLLATLHFSGKRGMNRLRILKVRKHRLQAGRYRAIVTAGHRSRRVSFTVEGQDRQAGPSSGELGQIRELTKSTQAESEALLLGGRARYCTPWLSAAVVARLRRAPVAA